MKRARYGVLVRRVTAHTAGYTIIESLIFLAVSAAIAVSAMILVSGQQSKTEFTQAVREFESQLQDMSNDVSTGFSSISGDTCWINAAGVLQTSGAPPPQRRCVFIGRVLQLNGGASNNMITRTLVGKQFNASGDDVADLVEAGPVVYPSATLTDTLPGGMKLGKIKCSECANPTTIRAFAFVTTFNGGNLTSGSAHTDIVPIDQVAIPPVYSPAATLAASMTTINPASGLTICLLSGGTNQHAEFTIGGTSGQLVINTVIDSGNTAGDCP